jgi:hypothetical protein
VVLAELACGIAERLEQLRYGGIFFLQSKGGARQPDLGHSSPQAGLTREERGASRSTTLLRIVVREHHALACEAVDIGRLIAHHPP